MAQVVSPDPSVFDPVPRRRRGRRDAGHDHQRGVHSACFFLSALGGEFADRHDKARVAQRLKFVESFVATVAVLG